MADAVSVGHQAASSRRYYCYVCRTEVQISNDFNCLRCRSGFVVEIAGRVLIERLTYVTRSRGQGENVEVVSAVSDTAEVNNNNNLDNNNNNITGSGTSGSTNSGTSIGSSTNGYVTASEIPVETAATTSIGSGGLGSVFGGGRSDNLRSAMMNMLLDVFDVFGNIGGNTGMDSLDSNSGNSTSSGTTTESTNRSRSTAVPDDMRTRVRQWMASHVTAIRARDSARSNMVYDLMDVALGTAGNGNGTAGNQMFFVSDTTGLSRQEESVRSIFRSVINYLANGSPPLSQQKIDQIPKIEITEEDMVKYDVCSICQEHFQLKETVRKLPCTHLFHEPCILPWLNLHRTCPVCRSWLGMNITSDCTNSALNEQEVNGDGVSLNHSSSVQSESSVASDDVSTDDGMSSTEALSMDNNYS